MSQAIFVVGIIMILFFVLDIFLALITAQAKNVAIALAIT